MKRLMIAACAGVVLAGSALAGTVEAFLANTVQTTMDGQTTNWRFNADGSYTAALPDGTAAAGTWVQRDGQFCVTIPSTGESCTTIADGKGVGDSWQATNSAGQSFTVRIVAGR